MTLKTTSSILFSMLVATGAAYGQFSYLDASTSNTTLANGNPFSPPLNASTGNDNLWEQRTVFGSGGNIFEAGGEAAAEDVGEIRTTISGLIAGVTYQIYVNFWDPTSMVEDWSVRAGFTSNPGANTLFAAADAATDLPGSVAAVLASTLTYSTAPTVYLEGGRDNLAGFVGTTTADGSGQIHIYIDDKNAATSVNLRTWYDGVSYAAIPEPGTYSLFMGAFAAMFCVFRIRRRA